MTDVARQKSRPALPSVPPPGGEALEATVYSKDYWDLVFEQLGRRKLFRIGMAVLALLYASAIYAPLIANDRPYVIEAIDLDGYANAVRNLSAVATAAERKAEQTPAEYLASRSTEEAAPTLRAALEEEHNALILRTELMRRYLPEGRGAELVELESLFELGLEQSERGDREAAVATFGEAKTLARALRSELAALDPAEPEEGGVPLVAAKSYPLMESLSHWEIFFMVLWALLLTWPLWNRVLNRLVLGGNRELVRRWRRRKLAGVLALSALSAVGWRLTVHGGGQPFDVAPYKGALTDGGMLLVKAGMGAGESDSASRPVWPPVPYGFAETHPEAMFRPPTWRHNAEIDEEGRYVRGPRAAASVADETTGFEAAVTPIEVRAGELPRNHPLRRIAGADELGRDFFTRILWGGRVSLTVGILSAALLTVIGVVIGSIAGYFGGRVDVTIMRGIEIIQSIPAFFLILLAMAFVDPQVVHPIVAIIVVIALIRWTGVARLVRGEFLRLREQEFVLAARALGFSSRRTIFRHVLPNAMSPVLVSTAFAVAAGILTESAVSFLGFGTRPPEASWGSLVSESKNPSFWWIQVFPGILIFLTVTCYNLVGDAFRDALDPKMKV